MAAQSSDAGSATIVVFADGAARGNPGPGGWGAIIALPEGRVVELGGGAGHTTNNRMELTAVREALRLVASRSEPVVVHTDSTYVIHGITQWIHGWRRKGWKTQQGTDVINRDLWESLAEVAGPRIQWRHVRGHAGIPGNERVDAIASAFAAATPIDLYDGPAEAYDVDLDAGVGADAAARASGPKGRRAAPRSKGAAYSYLSLLGGEVQRHATWADCERRVKGQSGARFKKATSAENEVAILGAWGIGRDRLPPKR